MNHKLLLPVFTATLFISALLLFSIQPLVSKMLLPMLGGSPSVWNTAMVFFQVMLLLGYAYAHVSAKLLSFRTQAILHIILMLGALLSGPLFLPDNIMPPEGSGQAWWQLKTMLLVIGGPFFILAASAPLFQHWFSGSNHKDAANPYFLYAVSNAGSMAALLLYPILIEPLMTLTGQKTVWLTGFSALMLLAGLCALIIRGNLKTVAAASSDDPAPAALTWQNRFTWVFLAFVPSSLMLGITTYITTDLASVPMLWVIPLALYLATFIIAFSRKPVISLKAARFITPFALIMVALYFMAMFTGHAKPWMIALHALAFFMGSLLCHHELSRLKPSVKHLTEFYLLMSFGGVLGGVFNALIAPALFQLPFEYCLSLACLPIVLWACATKLSLPSKKERAKRYALNASIIALVLGGSYFAIFTDNPSAQIIIFLVIAFLLIFTIPQRGTFAILCVIVLISFQPDFLRHTNNTLERDRNYFGMLKVARDGAAHYFYHGTTLHGAQFINSRVPVTYYSPEGPVGDIFRNLGTKQGAQRVAVMGLGVGSVACFRGDGRSFDFYEIDADVVRIATNEKYFTYLSNCGSPYTIIMGDARLRMAQAQNNLYDLIFVDTFSSDNIPVHIMTREAMQTYLEKLQKNGVIVVNISNRYLDLSYPLGAIVRELGLSMSVRYYQPVRKENTASMLFEGSRYVVIARNDKDLSYFTKKKGWDKVDVGDFRPWTDDYVNIISSLYVFHLKDE